MGFQKTKQKLCCLFSHSEAVLSAGRHRQGMAKGLLDTGRQKRSVVRAEVAAFGSLRTPLLPMWEKALLPPY